MIQLIFGSFVNDFIFLSSFNDKNESHCIMSILVLIGSSISGIAYEKNTYIIRNGHPYLYYRVANFLYELGQFQLEMHHF